MRKTLPVLTAAVLLLSWACSRDDRSWRKAQEQDTVQAYAAYRVDFPGGKHISEAAQRVEYLGRKEVVDAAFKGLAEKYDYSGIPYTLQKRTAEPEGAMDESPSPRMTINMPPPPPPPPPPPASKSAGDKFVSPVEIPSGPEISKEIILTVDPDGSYRLHRKKVGSSGLVARLRDIYAPKRDKTIFFRFLRPVEDYEEIVDLFILMKRAGIENVVPLITPQIKDVVWAEFQGTIDLPVPVEDIYAREDGLDPEAVPEEDSPDFGVAGGVEGGVEGGVVGGVLCGVVGGVPGGEGSDVEAPVRVGGAVKPPKLIKEVPAVYPQIARAARVEGVVILEAMTDIYGQVTSCKVIRSIPLLDQAAVDAVRQWVYEPLLVNGRPRGAIFTVTVNFRLL